MATTVQMKVSAEDLSQLPKGGGERIPNPGIMVIFGASGDLTKRKLLPALFHLEQAGLLPKEFAIVGVARRALGDEFATDMRSGIVEFGGVKDSDPKLEEFAKKISYYALNFDDRFALCRVERGTESHREGKGHRTGSAFLSGNSAGVFCSNHREPGHTGNGAAGAGPRGRGDREAVWP